MAPPSGANAPVELRQKPSHDDDLLLNSVLNMPFEDHGEDPLNWNDPEIDFTDFLNAQTMIENVDYSYSAASLVRHSTPLIYQTIPAQQDLVSSRVSIPPTPSTYSHRSLILRTNTMTGANKSANLILGALKSYPQMMLKNNTLPPFIHPLSVTSDGDDDQMEPLSDCISLVHMMSTGTQSSRRLFWKNVRMECERLRAEVYSHFYWLYNYSHGS